MSDKIPANDKDLEATVLGTILLEKDAYSEVSALLNSDLWYYDSHRNIYEAIKRLNTKNSPIDIRTVTFELKAMGKLEDAGGVFYISELTSFGVYGHLETHVRILIQLLLKRKQIEIGQNILNNAYDLTIDVFESIESIESSLNNLNKYIIGNDSEKNLPESIAKTYEHLMTPRESGCTGIKTGNGQLTDILGGFNPEFILLCGRPSMGKTTRMMQFAMEVAEQTEPVAIFSLEMVQLHQVNTKLLNYVSGVDSNIINSQAYNTEERELMAFAKDHISKLPIYINDKSHISPNYIRSICRQLQRKSGLSMIFIDYLQLMKPNEFVKGRNRDLELGDITSSLKSIVKDLGVPIMALSQLSRQCEDRNDKRPQLRDLRESGNLEQDADVIMSVFRPFYYSPENPEQEYRHLAPSQYEMVCELGIMKHRMGGAQKVITEYFDKPKSKFNTKL